MMSGYIYRHLLKHLRRNLFISRNLETISDIQRCSYSKTISSQLNDNKTPVYGDKSFVRRVNREKDLEATGDPDVFGDLTKDLKLQKKMDLMPEEEDDIVRKDFYHGKVGKRRLSTKQYADIIKQYLNDKKLVEAINVLEVKMIKEDGMKPENYIYNLLIDGCAKVGYTEKAFKLYNDMKKRDLKVTGATYTSLFNACALSPVPGDGLKRAVHLREITIEKQALLNISNYHSMIKAFGRCGDLATAFSIVDEMISNKIRLKPDTFCFLFQACLSDKSNGFRHAVMVWRKMRDMRVKPTIYCYNLMLRCARDCELGDTLQLTQDLHLLSNTQTDVKLLGDKIDNNKEELYLPSGSEGTDLPVSPPVLPNLLAVTPAMGSVVSINRIVKPKHRLMLLGGSVGIIDQMNTEGIQADVKTATILLDLVPKTSRDEQDLIDTLKKAGVSLDIDFCNMLIKKRCFRKDYFSAKEVLRIISDLKLVPNLMTFGVLSLSCRSTQEAVQFLKDLDNTGFRPNMEILGGLLYAARHTWNVTLIMFLMDKVIQEEMKVSSVFLKNIDKFRNFTERQIESKRQGFSYHEKIDDPVYMEAYDKFLDKFKLWSSAIVMDERDRLHPWKQYKIKKTAHIDSNEERH